MSNVASTKSKTKRTRVDNVGDALRAARRKPKNWYRHIALYAVEYSREHGLMWHLGAAEHSSAVYQMQARMRVHIPADMANYQKGVKEGEFVDLNGTKLFGTDSSKEHKWNLGRKTMPMPKEAVVTGLEHPAIVRVKDMAQQVGDHALTEVDKKTGRSPLDEIAKYSIKKRDLAVKTLIRNYQQIAMAKADAEEVRAELQETTKLLQNAMTEMEILKLQTAQTQLEFNREISTLRDSLEATVKEELEKAFAARAAENVG